MISRLKPTLGWRELWAGFAPPRRDEVARFESMFAELAGQKHAIAFPYGRTALMVLLEALGLQGREIICPAYTCVVVPHAIVTGGNEPVFVDSRESDFNMNLDLAEKAVTSRTGAVVATSLFGFPVDLDRLDRLRANHPELAIVQDCAHGFFAEWEGRPVNAAGDAAIFGLNVSKLMTSIFGGMVTTDRDDLAAKIRACRDRRLLPATWRKGFLRRLYLACMYPTFTGPIYGMTNYLERTGWLDRFTRYYDEGRIEMPTDHLVGMTSAEARVGQMQIARYREIISHRRRIAEFYDRRLEGTPGLRLPPRVPGATWSHYVVRTSERRAMLASALARGVQLGQLIEYCIPRMPAYAARPGSRLSTPIADRLAESTINLPLWVNDRQAARVAATVEACAAAMPAVARAA